MSTNILTSAEQKAAASFQSALKANKGLLKTFRDAMAKNFADEYQVVKPTKLYLNKEDILGAAVTAANKTIKDLDTLGTVSDSEEEAPAKPKVAKTAKATQAKKDKKASKKKGAEDASASE